MEFHGSIGSPSSIITPFHTSSKWHWIESNCTFSCWSEGRQPAKRWLCRYAVIHSHTTCSRSQFSVHLCSYTCWHKRRCQRFFLSLCSFRPYDCKSRYQLRWKNENAIISNGSNEFSTTSSLYAAVHSCAPTRRRYWRNNKMMKHAVNLFPSKKCAREQDRYSEIWTWTVRQELNWTQWMNKESTGQRFYVSKVSFSPSIWLCRCILNSNHPFNDFPRCCHIITWAWHPLLPFHNLEADAIVWLTH